ncbi:MAG: MFS transporter [Gammaproteobacteria bacterium]|nr:MFS transporter [Gammaproteobacteria bacterium]
MASNPNTLTLAPKRELFAWAMYDFANSGYTTVVLTAVFNTYFVAVVAGVDSGYRSGTGTFLWSLVLAVANAVVLFSAPVLGAIADRRANKKRLLVITTSGCVVCTALLATVGSGEVLLASVLVILATIMFASGENLIAAFLTELAPPHEMGRVSGYGWGLGYVGGMLVLGLCLIYVSWAQQSGHIATQYVPVTMCITALAFALASLPTFLWLRERAVPQSTQFSPAPYYITIVTALRNVVSTCRDAARFTDLFRFLAALAVYTSGIHTVIILAAVYAQEAMGFNTKDILAMILVVNITAATGALIFGYVQDRVGSLRTLKLTLVIWIAAVVVAYFAQGRFSFWVAANLVGVALGSSQSAGRALIGQFAPPAQSAEIFGLWGLAVKLAAIVGPLCYGAIVYISGGNHRVAIVSTLVFFVIGLIMLWRVDEHRAQATAHSTAAR